MLKIKLPQQASLAPSSETTQRLSVKISIKSICNKSICKTLHSLADKCHRFSKEIKERSANQRGTLSKTELNSSQSSVMSDALTPSSSHDGLTTINLQSQNSAATFESTLELSIKHESSIPPAPPLPGATPPTPPLNLSKGAPKSSSDSLDSVNENHSKLMEQIRQGVKLKSATKSLSADKSSADTHSKLMEELLTGGTKLKKVAISEIPAPPPLPSASTSKYPDSRNALLSEIAGFSKDRLRKTGSSETLNSSQSKEQESSKPTELLLSEDLFKQSSTLSELELNDLASKLADYMLQAAEINWLQVISEKTRGFTTADMAKSEHKYVQAFCGEILKYPDCYKSADVASPESPKSGGHSVVDVALKRLQAGRERLFTTTDTKGNRELKKGEAILESAINAARKAMSAEEKSTLLSNNVKSATFKVFYELPCMEGFAEQNGKAAFNSLRSAFYSAVKNKNTAKQDITNFMKDNLRVGFSGYSYQGLTNRVAQLEAQLAALSAKLS
ncbi:WH2 domain-containing protein [Vibrio parahaemolyticus]|uniref:WH2 domain-containing protein n=1 Tax=Vibrio parahaemolyticus TaxID=670 RepID=UPI0007B6DCD1|nr:WH2 domain-containing protein [Vibrio parahaemolyticus]ANB97495.1 WH2 motif protein [Vibrio parahaemolyticus]EGQ9275179.1 T3SS2 effector VopL nucleation of actin polymerization [Vibrio parahaemolyticus]EGQ9712479.1 T3SS2 effector VopL nucleation of actin polymerization [Vibrio parahaemolyticus]EGQ9799234.1 T3SS2 effector VopL nucleation of actin polymerization [Vibrio parahaemolyticus]EIA0904466.1 T3SS2 effector VopL nucleation of actin polymerization [Vibrio parahaemolyticus]